MGGRSGGGRSGGSRSFGGRSSSSGRGGGRSIGGSSSGGSSFGGGRSGYGGSYYGGPVFYGRPYIGKTAVILILVLAVVIVLFVLIGGGSSGSIAKSSYRREPLPSGTVNEGEYLRDDAKWIDHVSMVKNSMRYFYQKTGVQPYLWITQSINGSKDASWEEIEAAVEKLYEDEFTDEGHLIVLFYEPRENEYKTAYLAGSAAKTVIDDEAAEILLDYLDKYYYSTGMKDDEYFSTVFTKTADRIMSVTMAPGLIIAFIAGALAFLVILSVVLITVLKHRRLKRQQDIEILNTEVGKLGEDPASVLAKKYEGEQEE
jgi:uncharacterized membrane protein